jgi:replication initiation and membrane attachment protein
MLSSIYQPMIGTCAISLYTLLYQQLPADKIGYSPLEQQRRLFLSLALEPNERGRKTLIEQASKLEAVGLIQSNRKYFTDSDDYVYEYQLSQPLSPPVFFDNQHLVLLLRDKIGKHMVLFIKEELEASEPEEMRKQQINTENISVPFYDLFQLNTQAIDYELEQALAEMAPARSTGYELDTVTKLHYADIIMRFPRDSQNRSFVEQLKYKEDQMATVNYVAKKYNLSLQEICRLLDEDTVFDEDGSLRVDTLQHKANLNYRQDTKREEDRDRYLHKVSKAEGNQMEGEDTQEEKAVEMDSYLEIPSMFINQCNIHQYNMMMRNEPYTLVLKRFFPGSVPDHVSKIFEKIDLNYKLKEEVINVLIHYLKVYNLSWNKAFIDSIVSDMLGKQINSYEQAVKYIRDHNQAKEKSRNQSTASMRNKGKQKPKIPIVSVPKKASVSDEDYEKILKKAQKLEGN